MASGDERILVIDDEPGVREALDGVLSDEGFRVTTVESGEQALEVVRSERFDAVLLDVWLPGIDGLQTLTELRKGGLEAEVVMISGHGTIETAVRATKLGAFDFVEKPLSLDRTLLVLRNALRQRRLERANRRLMAQLHRDIELPGNAAAVVELRKRVEAAVDGDAAVLIVGAQGSGRELVARRLHHASDRGDDPFVEIPCGALSPDSAERALFGEDDEPSRIDLAGKGTLFLEDVDRLPSALQRRLAAALTDRRRRTPRARLVASAVGPAALDEELRQVLDVVRIEVPSLARRRDDIPLLAERFMSALAQEYGREARRLHPEAVQVLLAHDWPGEVRALHNLVERLLVAGEGPIEAAEVEAALLARGEEAAPLTLEQALERHAREHARRALAVYGGDRERAAAALSVDLERLERLLGAG